MPTAKQVFNESFQTLLLTSKIGNRSRGTNKKLKAPKNYGHSRPYRFALVAARKDRNVFVSSKGMFLSVADLKAGKRARPKKEKPPCLLPRSSSSSTPPSPASGTESSVPSATTA